MKEISIEERERFFSLCHRRNWKELDRLNDYPAEYLIVISALYSLYHPGEVEKLNKGLGRWDLRLSGALLPPKNYTHPLMHVCLIDFIFAGLIIIGNIALFHGNNSLNDPALANTLKNYVQTNRAILGQIMTNPSFHRVLTKDKLDFTRALFGDLICFEDKDRILAEREALCRDVEQLLNQFFKFETPNCNVSYYKSDSGEAIYSNVNPCQLIFESDPDVEVVEQYCEQLNKIGIKNNNFIGEEGMGVSFPYSIQQLRDLLKKLSTSKTDILVRTGSPIHNNNRNLMSTDISTTFSFK